MAVVVVQQAKTQHKGLASVVEQAHSGVQSLIM
jgi:hypothetical protein